MMIIFVVHVVVFVGLFILHKLDIPSRWEEEPHPEGVKWIFLEHKGPVFAPPYEPLPDDVKFYYDGKCYLQIMLMHCSFKVGRVVCAS